MWKSFFGFMKTQFSVYVFCLLILWCECVCVCGCVIRIRCLLECSFKFIDDWFASKYVIERREKTLTKKWFSLSWNIKKKLKQLKCHRSTQTAFKHDSWQLYSPINYFVQLKSPNDITVKIFAENSTVFIYVQHVCKPKLPTVDLIVKNCLVSPVTTIHSTR